MHKTIPPFITIIIILAFFVLLFNALSMMMKPPTPSGTVMVAPLEMDGENIIENTYAIYFQEGFKESLDGMPEDIQRIYAYLSITNPSIAASAMDGDKILLEKKIYTPFTFPLEDDCIDETKCWVKYELTTNQI